MALQNPDIKLPAAPNPTPRIIAILFIVSLLVTAFVMNRKNAPQNEGSRTSPQGVQKVDAAAAQKRYGFALSEVAAQSGIRFTHTPPKLDTKLNHIMPEIAAMGASVSVVDFDRDGWNDLYVTDSGEGSRTTCTTTSTTARLRM